MSVFLLVGLNTWSKSASGDISVSGNDVLPVFVEQSSAEDSSAQEILQFTDCGHVNDDVMLLSHLKVGSRNQLFSVVQCEAEKPYEKTTADIVTTDSGLTALDNLVIQQPASDSAVTASVANRFLVESADCEIAGCRLVSGDVDTDSGVCLSILETKDSDSLERHSSKSVFCLSGNVKDCFISKPTTAYVTDKFQRVSVASDVELSTMQPIHDMLPCESSVIYTSDCNDLVSVHCQPPANDAVHLDYTVGRSVHKTDVNVTECIETLGTIKKIPGYSNKPLSDTHGLADHIDKTELVSVDTVPSVMDNELLISIERSTGGYVVETSSPEEISGYVEFVETPLAEVGRPDNVVPASGGLKCQEQLTEVSVLSSVFVTASDPNFYAMKLRTNDYDLVAKATDLAVSSLQSAAVKSVQASDELSDGDARQLSGPHTSLLSGDLSSLASVELESNKVKSLIFIFYCLL